MVFDFDYCDMKEHQKESIFCLEHDIDSDPGLEAFLIYFSILYLFLSIYCWKKCLCSPTKTECPILNINIFWFYVLIAIATLSNII